MGVDRRLVSALGCAAILMAPAVSAKRFIEVWDPVTPQNVHGKGLIAVYDAWNRKHPEMPVKRISIGDPRDKLMTAMVAGTVPDLIYFDRFQVPSYAAKNLFTPLDPYIKTSKVIRPEAFFAAAWDETVYAGKHWALPHEVLGRSLVIMDRVAQESGLNPDNPPKTLDDLEQWSRKMTVKDASGLIKRLGFAPTRGNWFYYGWLWNFGGQLLSADKSKPAFNSPEGKAALNWIVDYTNRALGGFSGLSKAEGKFQGGTYERKGPLQGEQIGMEIEGPWMIELMKSYSPTVPYTLAPIPAPAGRKSITWVGGWSWVMPKGAKNAKDAWKFLEFQGSEEGQTLFARVSGRIPARKASAYDPAFLAIDPKRMRDAVDSLAGGIYRPTTPVGDKLWEVLNNQMMASVRSGKRSPEQALSWAEQEISKEIGRYKVRL